MPSISKRAGSVKPSVTMVVAAREKEMRARGIDVISFGAGEPDFDTPDNIKKAAIQAIQSGLTKYTAAGGTPELKKAIQSKLKRENSLDYPLDQIIVSCGAKHSIYNILQAIVSKGDEVIIPAPYWVSYPDMVLLADGSPVIIPTKEENNFAIGIKDLERQISPRTKAIILNSPSNPTGSVYPEKALREIAGFLEDRDIFIISDEIYEHLIYEGSHISIASLSDKIKGKTITVNGVSKTYSMTGWRIGYAAGPKEVIRAMDAIQSQSTSNPSSVSQAASLEALNGDQSCVKSMAKAFDERRRCMVKTLNQIPGISCRMPEGTFYAFPKISSLYGKNHQGQRISNSLDFSNLLLDKAHVAVVPGSGFGDDSHVRLSYACSMESIRTGLKRISDFVQDLS
jgi:aspartate aminotransferase